MRIGWLVDGVGGDWATGLTSVAASNRYRAIIPATELRRQGHAVEMFSMSDASWPGRAQQFGADALVVSKQFGWQDRPRYDKLAGARIEGMRILAKSGIPVVVDFCDDHFGDPFLGPHWRAMATEAHLCVACSAELQASVRAQTPRHVEVVGDPVGSPRLQPRVFKPRSIVQTGLQRLIGTALAVHRLRLVWYGSLGNVEPLFAWADKLASVAEDQPWWLSVVTNEATAVQQRIDRFNGSHAGKAMLELVPWSESSQWQTVEASDVVLIPADLSLRGKRAKTANRLTDALHAGRAVIASPLPSYMPFADSAVLTDDPCAELRQYLADPARALQRIGAGQAYALEHASPARIAARWLATLEEARVLL
jgi:hypothetical protein